MDRVELTTIKETLLIFIAVTPFAFFVPFFVPRISFHTLLRLSSQLCFSKEIALHQKIADKAVEYKYGIGFYKLE